MQKIVLIVTGPFSVQADSNTEVRYADTPGQQAAKGANLDLEVVDPVTGQKTLLSKLMKKKE